MRCTALILPHGVKIYKCDYSAIANGLMPSQIFTQTHRQQIPTQKAGVEQWLARSGMIAFVVTLYTSFSLVKSDSGWAARQVYAFATCLEKQADGADWADKDGRRRRIK
jgi:hypothetical protein